MTELVRELSESGVQVNVTALMTLRAGRADRRAPCATARRATSRCSPGRIADTGRDPVPMMTEALAAMADAPDAELIWASPREVLNIVQADEIGCHIITVTHDLLAKLHLLGKNLDEYSLDTVKMFHDDAASAGFALEPAQVSG